MLFGNFPEIAMFAGGFIHAAPLFEGSGEVLFDLRVNSNGKPSLVLTINVGVLTIKY